MSGPLKAPPLPVLVNNMGGCALGLREAGAAAAASRAPLLPDEAMSNEASHSSDTTEGSDDSSCTRCSAGSGWGGTRTPTDDFVEQKRAVKWLQDKGSDTKAMPPRVYVDNKTLIRQVPDLCSLKRGDHCVVAINVLRASTPFLDYAVSWLGSIEICYLYHHFIVLDDVDHLDDAGLPCTADGRMAMIVEWGNTTREACAEVFATAKGPLSLPITALKFVLFAKAKFTKHPLADYGDTPHIYLVLGQQSPDERERTVVKALKMHDHENKRRYNIFFNNCEHACNQIRHGAHHSPQLVFACWTLLRFVLGLIGLFSLTVDHQWLGLEDSRLASLGVSGASWAIYLIFTCLPVALQATISYILLTKSVLCQWRQALITTHECYHLLGKELGRAIVVGSWTVLAIAATPAVVSSSGLRFGVCACAFTVSDMLYNCFAHAVMRLVLLPVWGRVWLLHHSEGPQVPAKAKLC